jgi:hypothetical protein
MTWPMSADSTIINMDETLEIVRQPDKIYSGVIYVGGKPQRNVAEVRIFSCICNVQPITGRDLELLAAGDEDNDQLWVWTNQHQEALKTGDLMIRQCKTYQCQSAEDWGRYTRARFVADETLPQFDSDTDTPFSP